MSLPAMALPNNVSCQIWGEYRKNPPVKNTQDEEVPEYVEKLQEKNGCEDLPFEPPSHENALSRRPTTRRLSIVACGIRKAEQENVKGIPTELDRNLYTQT
jgi:hypothetical protein